MMQKCPTKKFRGFTLVETMVAISVLSLAIIGTFTAVQKSLQASTFARDQVTAFYLAQEAIEYVRNVRDSNNLYTAANPASPRDWLYGLAALGSDPCSIGKTCTIDSYKAIADWCTNGAGMCPNLNQDTGGGGTGLYGYTPVGGTWTQTRFRREIQITQLSANEAVISVSISWTSGVITKSFTVKETILKWQ